jgi:polar amino acid transport system substrate-binding protein
MGLEASFIYFGYDGLYDALTTHQVDVLISALVIASERTQDVAYTRPYFNAGQILILGVQTDIDQFADLAGKQLAVELGSLGHVEARERQRKMVDLKIRPYNSVSDALSAVEAGDADAALVDGVSGRLYLNELPERNRKLIRLPEVITLEPYAVAVRIEDKRLLEEIDSRLLDLSLSGALDEIISKHLGP